MRKECDGFLGRKRDICNGESGLSLRDTNKYRNEWNLDPIEKLGNEESHSVRLSGKSGIEKKPGDCGCGKKKK